MKTLKDAFDRAKNPPRREMVIRYNGYRLNKNCTLCIVEGVSDKEFYSHSQIQPLSSDCVYVWHKNGGMSPDQDQLHKGKAAVIQTYFDIKNDINLQGDLQRTIFIVDKDYDREIAHNNQILQQADRRCITVTRYHSFENYFVTEGNALNVFETLSVEDKYVDDFLEQIQSFSKEIAEYFALLASITACYKYGWRKPTFIKSESNFFNSLCFDDSGRYWFDRNAIKAEVGEMEYAIRNISEAQDYKQYVLKVLLDYKYIQGHLAFSFIQKYLKDVLGIKFGYHFEDYQTNEMYYQCINKLDIEIRLVTGLGQRIDKIKS